MRKPGPSPMWLFNLGRRIGAIEVSLCRVLKRQEVMMAKMDDIRTLLATLDTETTAMAERVEAIVDQLRGGVTASEADELIAALTADAERLRLFGTDPADPFPGVPAPPPPPPQL